MANVNKEQALIEFLRGCSEIASNPLFFNFINAKPDNQQLITNGNDRSVHKPYIDGSVLKRYTLTVIVFKSATYQAVVTPPTQLPGETDAYINENVEEYIDIQAIIDWVDEQNDTHNYPSFGSDCQIEEMKVLTDNPVLNGVDTQLKPALAKYSFSIQIDYIDTGKTITN